MADKRIGELPSADGLYDDTLLVAEQQGMAVKLTGAQIKQAGGGGGTGPAGEDGATFIPEVSEDGVISWTNDKGLPNPAPVNIKGPSGEGGGDVDLSNVVTIPGGAHIVLDGDFGNPPYEIRISASGISVISSYTVTLSVDPTGGGTVTGEGSYRAGSTVTVTASPEDNYSFSKWERNGVSASADASYTFTVTEDTELTAVFEAVPVAPALGEWSEATMATDQNYNNVAYGNNMFLAAPASSSNLINYSYDGETWLDMDLPTNIQVGAIGYGESLGFVIFPNGTNNGAYRLDSDRTWRTMTVPRSSNGVAVSFGGGRFVAVTDDGYSLVSTDCVNWTAYNTPSSCTSYWHGITYGAGKFVAVGYPDFEDTTQKCAAWSSDGITWTPIDIDLAYWKSIAYGGGRFAAVSNTDHMFAHSDDGISWVVTNSPFPSVYFQSIAYGSGFFVACSSTYSEYSTVTVYSTDGVDWTGKSIPAGRWYSIAYGNNRFVAVSTGTAKAAYLPVS